MRLRDLALLAGAAGAASLVYGAVVESDHVVLERYTLPLPNWPERLRGFRIALLGDLHVRDKYSLRVAQDAIAMALAEAPDMVALVGDFVAYWKPESPRVLGELLEPLLLMEGRAVAVPGNHDYFYGMSSDLLKMILDELNVRLLRNEAWHHAGVTWVGMDDYKESVSDPAKAMRQADALESDAPRIALWHEPDVVDRLPPGCVLQLSGHSHGGQYHFPFGIVPMKCEYGRKYVQGFYPKAPTPLFVTRGVGTTGPPCRFLCPPEVAILTLVPG